tara:strand:- start:430 stop:666 length:237 start_codon:yes stop_codon:yes gene_type:complete
MQLSKEELQKLNEYQQLNQEIIFALGEVELQKAGLIDRYREVSSQQEELGSELNKKYGDGKINLTSGEITPLEEQTNK